MTEHLRVYLVSPVGLDTYTSVAPEPTSKQGNVMMWEKSTLSPGEHFTIIVQCPDGSFLTKSPPATAAIKSWIEASKGTATVIAVVGGIILLAVVMGIVQARKNHQIVLAEAAETEKLMAEDPAKKKQVEEAFDEHLQKKKIQADEQGRYYDRTYGDYITPAIWWAILSNQSRAGSSCVAGGSSCVAIGGGSRPGCACACVSCACACACACAGGGAAGCARKGFHECRECLEPTQTDNTPTILRGGSNGQTTA